MSPSNSEAQRSDAAASSPLSPSKRDSARGPQLTMAEAPVAAEPRVGVIEILIALCTGGLLTFMVLLNGMMASYTTPFFSSVAAHGTGTIAAGLALVVVWALRTRRAERPKLGQAPLWAYLGGLSGALTVVLTSMTVNTPLALTGTLALGLAGQVVLSLIFDRYGLMGMVKRAPTQRDFLSLALILAGALMIIFAGGAA